MKENINDVKEYFKKCNEAEKMGMVYIPPMRVKRDKNGQIIKITPTIGSMFTKEKER
jgi:hypothetical protein